MAKKTTISPLLKSKTNMPRNPVGIKAPRRNDVLCGRGGRANHHHGNTVFRRVVALNRHVYNSVPRHKKVVVADSIVHAICHGAGDSALPGRFIELNKEDGLWYEIGPIRTREKTLQALRDQKLYKFENENDGKGKRAAADDEDSTDNSKKKKSQHPKRKKQRCSCKKNNTMNDISSADKKKKEGVEGSTSLNPIRILSPPPSPRETFPKFQSTVTTTTPTTAPPLRFVSLGPDDDSLPKDPTATTKTKASMKKKDVDLAETLLHLRRGNIGNSSETRTTYNENVINQRRQAMSLAVVTEGDGTATSRRSASSAFLVNNDQHNNLIIDSANVKKQKVDSISCGKKGNFGKKKEKDCSWQHEELRSSLSSSFSSSSVQEDEAVDMNFVFNILPRNKEEWKCEYCSTHGFDTLVSLCVHESKCSVIHRAK